MASIYKRNDSPYWWLKTKMNGKWTPKNTGLRVDSEVETAQAEILRAEAALSETIGGDGGEFHELVLSSLDEESFALEG